MHIEQNFSQLLSRNIIESFANLTKPVGPRNSNLDIYQQYVCTSPFAVLNTKSGRQSTNSNINPVPQPLPFEQDSVAMAGTEDYTMVDSTIEYEMQSQPSVPTPPRPSLSGYSWNTRDARYQPFPAMGDRHQSDMAEMCRPNPLPRWKRAKMYARGEKEPFSSFRNHEETADPDISFPTPTCQRLGCWQETPHVHSDDEIAHLNQGSARKASESEDVDQYLADYLSHFADDEALMRELLPPQLEQTLTRPPPRLRGPGSSRSVIDGSRKGTRELARALPTISEGLHEPASSMSLPDRPAGNVTSLPIRSMQISKAPTEIEQPGNVLAQPNDISPITDSDPILVDSDELPWEEVLGAELEKELDEEARRNGLLASEDDVE